MLQSSGWGGGDEEISHKLFVVDTLVFCQTDEDQLDYLKGVLICFEVVLRLKINIGKTDLILVGEVPIFFINNQKEISLTN